MENREIFIDELSCDKNKLDNTEINYWKNIFENGKPIPSPQVDANNNVVAFHNCFFALKDLGLLKSWFVLKD